ncbi:unnamed protein product [Peronospora farinosa]|uniref:Uncharacterized protein n=1 Tax=Peronospora farinosa TaxID=134698 RepID=A0AAV0TQI0_9STRA|nr:unnamed protein product [Peronospora farinosa]
MLKDMDHEQMGGTQVWEDNQGAIALASHAGYHAQTKNVDSRHHFIRENVQQEFLKIDYINTEKSSCEYAVKGTEDQNALFLHETTGIKTKPTHNKHSISGKWEC